MWGFVFGGGASPALLPSGETAGLMVETIPSTYLMNSYLDVSGEAKIVSALGAPESHAMPGRAHVDYHSVATQIAASSQ
jgi:hypothetical protein